MISIPVVKHLYHSTGILCPHILPRDISRLPANSIERTQVKVNLLKNFGTKQILWRIFFSKKVATLITFLHWISSGQRPIKCCVRRYSIPSLCRQFWHSLKRIEDIHIGVFICEEFALFVKKILQPTRNKFPRLHLRAKWLVKSDV